MANATRTTNVIEPERVIPAVTETTVTLVLTEDEAIYLRALTGSGHCVNPNDAIYIALRRAGVKNSSTSHIVIKPKTLSPGYTIYWEKM